jgi:hypothetical protein
MCRLSGNCGSLKFCHPQGPFPVCIGMIYVYCKEFPLFLQFEIFLKDGMFVLEEGLTNHAKNFYVFGNIFRRICKIVKSDYQLCSGRALVLRSARNNSAPTRGDFHEIWYSSIVKKSVEKIQFCWSWSGRPARTRPTALLSPRSEGKTKGCYCSWAPDDGREDARNKLSCI